MTIKNDKTDNKSRRLRKKLYLGEFAVKGFDLSFTSSAGESGDDAFFDDFIEIIEKRSLCIGGWAECAYITGYKRYQSATEEDRTTIIDWLRRDPRVASVIAGELEDANYNF